jgi:DNA-binding transcriptional ArsR family regulator
MDEHERRSVTRLSDPKALRALAHPIRLALVGLLRIHGQLTATKAGELLGESSASCSFHLRQLAKYGLVEEAPGGQGRERPWQATTMSTEWPEVAEDPKVEAAAGQLSAVIANQYLNDMLRWIQAMPDESDEWRRAAQFGDEWTYVTPDELSELGRLSRELVSVYRERLNKPELRPPGARLVSFLHVAHPLVGVPGTESDK